MLFFITPIIIMSSLLFMRLLHPLSMGLMLLFQTSLICMSSGLMSQSFWFSYILFLIFLGGMLVLFIYVASLASNESFNFSFSGVFLYIGALLTSVFLMFSDSLWMVFNMKISMPVLNMKFYNDLILVGTIYSTTTMMFTLYMVCYLLLTLFVIVKITSAHFGPLRLSF